MPETSWPIQFARSPNALLYDYALAAAWQAGAGWIPDPDYALQKDPAVYEKAERDLVLGHAMQQRRLEIAARPILVQPASDDPADKLKAEVHKELLGEIEGLSTSLSLLAKAVFQAADYKYVEGERRWAAIGSKHRESWWFPKRLRDVGWRRVRYATDYAKERGAEEGAPRVRDTWMELFSLDSMNFVRVRDTSGFVRFVYEDSEAGLNYGIGMMAALAYTLWMKERSLEYGLQWLERWALGFVDVGIDCEASGGPDLNSRKVRDATLAVFRSMAARHVVVHDKRDDVKVHNPGSEGYMASLKFCDYFDSAMTRRVLGSRLPTGGGGGGDGLGSGLRAEVEAESTDLVVGTDRHRLFECLTRDLGRLVEIRNRPQFDALGILHARPPKYVPEPQERDDPDAAAKIIEVVSRVGVPLVRTEVYKNLGYSQPQDDDEVFFDKPVAGPNGPGVPPGLPNLDRMRDLPDLDALLRAQG